MVIRHAARGSRHLRLRPVRPPTSATASRSMPRCAAAATWPPRRCCWRATATARWPRADQRGDPRRHLRHAAAARRRGRAAAPAPTAWSAGLPHAGAAAQRDDERAAATVAAPAISPMRTRRRGPAGAGIRQQLARRRRHARAAGPLQSVTLPVADRRWEVEIGVRSGAVPAPSMRPARWRCCWACCCRARWRPSPTCWCAPTRARRAKVHEATARLQAETRSLHESEQRFRMLFEHSMDAVLRTRPRRHRAGRQRRGLRAVPLQRGAPVRSAAPALVDRDDARLGPLLAARERDGNAGPAAHLRRPTAAASRPRCPPRSIPMPTACPRPA